MYLYPTTMSVKNEKLNLDSGTFFSFTLQSNDSLIHFMDDYI